MNCNALDFLDKVNHQLEYKAIEGLSIPMHTFSFNKSINFGSKICGTSIGFKSHGTCGTVNMTIGAITFGCIHAISFGEEAKAFAYLERIS